MTMNRFVLAARRAASILACLAIIPVSGATIAAAAPFHSFTDSAFHSDRESRHRESRDHDRRRHSTRESRARDCHTNPQKHYHRELGRSAWHRHSSRSCRVIRLREERRRGPGCVQIGPVFVCP